MIKRYFTFLMSVIVLVCSFAQYSPLTLADDTLTTEPMISIGGDFAVALASDGTLWSWGGNDKGQLGQGDAQTRKMATAILFDKKFVSVSAGYAHVLALTANGEVYAWGDNTYGQLGQDEQNQQITERENLNTPTRVEGLASEDIIAVAAGGNTSFALTADGKLYSWGSNAGGMLGLKKDHTIMDITAPEQIITWGDGNTPFICNIFAGDATAAAITPDGKVWLWGENTTCQAGDSSAEDLFEPVCKAPTENYSALAVAFGVNHTAVLKADRTVSTMGVNDKGQFGNGQESSKVTVSITTEASKASIESNVKIKAIAAGNNHTIALTNDGALLAWGENSKGQLGIGEIGEIQKSPISVILSNEDRAVYIDAAYNNSAFIDSEGHVFAWGDNQFGQLGNNTVTPEEAVPTAVLKEGGSRLYLGLPSVDIVQNVYVSATATVPSPTFSISIPATLDFGTLEQKSSSAENVMKSLEFEITASNIKYLFGNRLSVKLVPGGTGNDFVLNGADGSTLPYAVYNATSQSALTKDAEFASFNSAGSAKGRIEIDQSRITHQTSYSGTLTFYVSTVEQGS